MLQQINIHQPSLGPICVLGAHISEPLGGVTVPNLRRYPVIVSIPPVEGTVTDWSEPVYHHLEEVLEVSEWQHVREWAAPVVDAPRQPASDWNGIQHLV